MVKYARILERNDLSSYRAFIPIAILIPLEKKAAFGIKLGEEVPKNVF